jgi:hypothetical protein
VTPVTVNVTLVRVKASEDREIAHVPLDEVVQLPVAPVLHDPRTTALETLPCVPEWTRIVTRAVHDWLCLVLERSRSPTCICGRTVTATVASAVPPWPSETVYPNASEPV